MECGFKETVRILQAVHKDRSTALLPMPNDSKASSRVQAAKENGEDGWRGDAALFADARCRVSKFRVGDLVEIVGGPNTSVFGQRLRGEIGIVTKVFVYEGKEACNVSCDHRSRGWYATALKLKRPPSWDRFIFDTQHVKDEQPEVTSV